MSQGGMMSFDHDKRLSRLEGGPQPGRPDAAAIAAAQKRQGARREHYIASALLRSPSLVQAAKDFLHTTMQDRAGDEEDRQALADAATLRAAGEDPAILPTRPGLLTLAEIEAELNRLFHDGLDG